MTLYLWLLYIPTINNMVAILLAKRYLLAPVLRLLRMPDIFYVFLFYVAYGLHIRAKINTAVGRNGKYLGVSDVAGGFLYKRPRISKVGFKNHELRYGIIYFVPLIARIILHPDQGIY